MLFPAEMTDSSCKRWLVRRILPGTDNKQPYSPLVERPAAYVPKSSDEKPNAWRWRWNQLCVCTTHEESYAYLRKHEECEGLSFVLHPGGDDSEQLRVICLDFDRAFGPNGRPWAEVQAVLDVADSFVEYSRSKKGLHLFMLVRCTPFTNVLQAKVNEHCACDVLCSAQVAVTGNVFESSEQLREVELSYLQSLPFFHHETASTATCDFDFAEWWSATEEDLTEEHESLADEMRAWPEAIKDHGRSKTTLAAACRILRDGVTGWQALRLLEMVPTTPPLSEAEAKHKLEDAYKKTTEDGTFDGGCPEFDEITEENMPEEIKATQPRKVNIYTVAELDALDVKLEFIIKGVFVDKQTTFIGGREKCFKTGVACDLLLSLSTGKPFLGQFEVVEPRSCVFFTAEIGLAPAKDLIRRVREAKGIEACTVHNMHVADYMPNFKQAPSIASLKKLLDKLKPQVVAFDPLYFAMGDATVGDMYEIGKVLRDIATVCAERDIWLIVCHHARKDQTKEFIPMELSDLYGAGVAAFARQWFLLSHAQPYVDGQANMYARMGGSATGDLGIWGLQITEGTIDEMVDTRRWDVIMEKGGGEFTAKDEDVFELIGEEPVSKRDIVAVTGLSTNTVQSAIQRLTKEGRIVCQNGKFTRTLPEEFAADGTKVDSTDA